MPSLEISVGDLLLALMRGCFVACMLSSFGVALFLSAVASPLWRLSPEGGARPIRRRCERLLAGSLLAAAGAGLSWLLLQTRQIAETQSVAETIVAVPTVLFGTRFGQVLCLQALALAMAALFMGLRRDRLVAMLGGLAVLLEAGHSHAFAMANGLSLLLLAQGLHLLAAGAWLGELLPLLAVVRRAPLEAAQRVLTRFSPIAAVSVAILAATALLQGAVLSGGLKRLFGTDYGAVLLLKLALFAALIAMAANNRLRLTPALASRNGEATRRSLALSIGIETAIGLMVVLAAAALSGLEPGTHITSG
jgi:putative copper resistance protein D